MFKKGDKVTRIASYNLTGTVYVQHFVVSSWGKQQATLVRVDDGSNAKFRIYTEHATLLQGIWSSKIIATADYNESVALEFAAQCIDDEHKRAEERHERALALHDDPKYVPAVPRASLTAFEDKVYSDHKAVAWKAAIK
jgi:hypothetical protein